MKVQCWGPVWSEKVGGWWWITSRSGWLLELLMELTIQRDHRNITSGYFQFSPKTRSISVSFLVCTSCKYISESSWSWLDYCIWFCRRGVWHRPGARLCGWGIFWVRQNVFLPDTRGKTWFEVTLIESDLGGFDQRDETWLVIKYITTFTGGNREVLSFLEEVLRALHCHFCQGF